MDRTDQQDPGAENGPFSRAWTEDRRHVLNVAYRLLGSMTEAEDVVQEAFARLLREDLAAIDEPRGWLVVVTTRLCLDHLRSARVRREAYVGPWFPEPLVNAGGSAVDPLDMVILDESVRMALLIVLEQLTPAERVVFVLHDVFDYAFEEIAPMVDRSPAACRQLGSRARRRVEGGMGAPRLKVDPQEMRRVAERFARACAGGEIKELLEILDPEVVGWADLGGGGAFPQPNAGRELVAERALAFFGPGSGSTLTLAEVNGETGILVTRGGRLFAVMTLLSTGGLVTAIYAIADQKKLTHVKAG